MRYQNPSTDPWRHWADRVELRDAGGVALVYSPTETATGAIPWADGAWRPPGVTASRAGRAAVSLLSGWRFSTSDPDLVEEVRGRGANVLRHAHSMSRAVPDSGWTDPTASAAGQPEVSIRGLNAAQAERQSHRLGPVYRRAYASGHPDAFEGDEQAAVEHLVAAARGEILGPLLPASQIALTGRRVVGACLVVDRPGRAPYGGPWVVDVFRDPDVEARGIGARLLAAALTAARDQGLAALSLVVSHGNVAARTLYFRLGFVEAEQSWTLALPEEDERPG